MIQRIEEFYREGAKFTSMLDTFAEKNGIRKAALADHICYKCDSAESYESIRKLFEFNSSFMYQSIISKRRISLIGLLNPISTFSGDISLLELSDQKPKPHNNQRNSFDHIEIYPRQISYDELVNRLISNRNDVKEIVRPHHTTHDIQLENGFIIRLTRGPLLEKVKKSEFV